MLYTIEMGKEIEKRARIGSVQEQILMLLLAGVAFGLSQSPTRQWKILKEIPREFGKTRRESFRKAAQKLYASRFITAQKKADGTYQLALSKTGMLHTRKYLVGNIRIKKPARWDGTWHVVMFDIPEYMRQIRNGFRYHLKKLEFYELQKSVFVHPYPCSDEIEQLAEFYDVRENVCILSTNDIDYGQKLERVFGLK